jgi:site-specific DNA-methyltransferase (adenine-specific)
MSAPTARMLIGDVFDRMRDIEAASVDLVLTSPPFLALRSYLPADHPNKGAEIGQEPDPAAFLDTLLRLTAECGRVLAPHGSIAVELGDTYAGSGGAGGDYRKGKLRDGQPAFRQRHDARTWPLPKSLCIIPHLYAACLAYGRNLLTGEPSPAGQWRVRNVVAWVRPNPPVGALGDKFRPATSYVVMATRHTRRYFDLDAVRGEPKREDNNRLNTAQAVTGSRNDDGGVFHTNGHPAGAPPLDWWEVPTQPYKGSHYAAWPERLLERPVLAMAPERVCTTCGAPSVRIVERVRSSVPRSDAYQEGRERAGGAFDRTGTTTYTHVGWSDCGHDTWRNGLVLDPFAGSGTTLAVATALGRDALGIDLDERNVALAAKRVHDGPRKLPRPTPPVRLRVTMPQPTLPVAA